MSIEAEKSVLGSIILNNDCFYEVSTILKEEDFYDGGTRRTYQRICSLADKNQPFDATTLNATRFPEVIEYAEVVPTAANATHYAGIVRDNSIRRQLDDSGRRIRGLAGDERPVDELLREAEESVFNIRTPGGRGELADIGVIAQQVFAEVEKRSEQANPLSGMSSGLTCLDDFLSGFSDGELIVIAGRPAMGKTALGLQVAVQAAQDTDEGVYIAELEMSKEQLTTRIFSQQLGIPAQNIQLGRLSEEGFDRLHDLAQTMSNWPLWIDDRGSNSVSGIYTAARRLKRTHGLRLVMVDYLQLLSGKGQNREQEVAGISRGLKMIARELSIPVILLAQLNRGCEMREDKRPKLADLRESGAVEQDTDEVCFIYRDEYYDPNTVDQGIAELLIRKNRDGRIGTARAKFEEEFTRFSDLEQ